MRHLLSELLRERGHEVETAASAEAALIAWRDRNFDILLLDWTLPGMSGLALCRRIRQAPGGEDAVVLVITGRDRPDDLTAVLDAGASDYIAKPLDPALLRTRLMVAERGAHEARDRKRARVALRESEETFRTLIESSPDSVLVHRDQEYVYVNPQLVRYLGYSRPEDIVGQNLESIIHPADHGQIRIRQAAFIDRGQASPPAEFRLLRRDATVVTAESTSMPVVYGGKPCVLTVLRDVTERKQLQSQLLLSDRMASVGTLAAGVAHELNNPLAYVISNLGLMGEELERGPTESAPEVMHELLEEAVHGAERMRNIIRDLKTFSKADDELPGTVDIGGILGSSINVCFNEIRHRARLVKNLGPTPKIEINESRLGQVFLNLLINAAHAIPEGKADEHRITISTSTDSEGWAVVIVGDTGVGIPRGDQVRIFDPFFTTKTHDKGTGLGLSICHNIVTGAGGSISVHSTLGVGTAFEVRFPPAKLVRPRKSTSTKLRALDADTPRLRVLVVDDEPLVGRSIRRALREHEVSVVSSGRDAIDALMSDPDAFDVILCDLMMPEVTGMDVFEEVQARVPELARRFVFMTGGAFTPRARQFLEEMANDFVEKPFELRVVRELVRQRAPLR